MTYFGGTTVAAVLRGAAPGWALSSASGLGLLLAWYCVFFSPGDAFFKVYSSSLVTALVRPLECLNTGYAVGSLGVDTALRSPLGKASTSVLLCGTVSGCGGGLLQEMFNVRLAPLQSRREGSVQALQGAMRACLLAVTYFLLVDPHDLVWHRLGQSPPVASPAAGVAVLALLNMFFVLVAPSAVDAPVQALEAVLPGFKASFVPSELGNNDKAAAAEPGAGKQEPESTSGQHPEADTGGTGSSSLRRRRRKGSKQE